MVCGCCQARAVRISLDKSNLILHARTDPQSHTVDSTFDELRLLTRIGTTRLAASVGVEARRSTTRSAMSSHPHARWRLLLVVQAYATANHTLIRNGGILKRAAATGGHDDHIHARVGVELSDWP